MPEWEYKTLEELYLYYKGRYTKGHQIRNKLNKQNLQILDEIELRYRLLSMLFHFGGNIMEEIVEGDPKEAKFYQVIIKEIMKIALPKEIKEKQDKNIPMPQEGVEQRKHMISAWNNFCEDSSHANIDAVMLYLDMMDTGEAILRYSFIFREMYHISVSKIGKKVA